MAEAGSSTVASRFVSSDALEAARTKREEEWRDLHAKLGQEPPPLPAEKDYDPRSLYEKLKEQKDKKEEAFEEKMKFKNQWRQLDDDELEFFHEKAVEKRRAELELQGEVNQELEAFKKAVAARRGQDASPPLASSSASAPSIPAPATGPTTDAASKPDRPSGAVPPPAAAAKPKKSFQQKSFLAGAVKRKAPSDAGQAAGAKKVAKPS